ncbi:MAG TPA: hypothetical protein VFK78_10900 [Gemmatimonadales bacterium]|nr:hypothetical protein [Gemmatimonadales bacterium]
MRGSTSTLAVLALALGARALPAQGVLDQFSYDNLRLSGIQLDAGPLGSNKLRGTLAGGVRVDYGAIAPGVRVLLGLSYYGGQFNRRALADFASRLRGVVNDPDSNFTIDVGAIKWWDLVGDIDLQYVLPQGHTAHAYIGIGAGLHLHHASGPAINGTFVQDALDGVSAALNGTVGVEFAIAPAWRITLDGRGVISSDMSLVSLRGGLMYRFPGAR